MRLYLFCHGLVSAVVLLPVLESDLRVPWMPAKYLSVFFEPRVNGALLHLHQARKWPAPFKHHDSVGTARVGGQLRLVGTGCEVLELMELGVRI